MTLKDIMTCKEYEKNGEKKKMWLKCGTLRTTDKGSSFIEFNHMPGVTFFVFEQKPKEQKQASQPNTPEDIVWEE